VSRLSSFIAGLKVAMLFASGASASHFIASESGPVRLLAMNLDGDGMGDHDADGVQLLDGYETDSGHYISPFDTGASPHSFDSDSDAAPDGFEVHQGPTRMIPPMSPHPLPPPSR